MLPEDSDGVEDRRPDGVALEGGAGARRARGVPSTGRSSARTPWKPSQFGSTYEPGWQDREPLNDDEIEAQAATAEQARGRTPKKGQRVIPSVDTLRDEPTPTDPSKTHYLAYIEGKVVEVDPPIITAKEST